MTARRLGAEDSRTRTAILDATASLLMEEGYQAVSSRQVAARVGVNSALVHYYFRTMDDLLLAVFRRGADAYLEALAQALASERPLRALWEISTEPRVMAEYLAVANHREVIRAEIAAYAERVRRIQEDALAAILRHHRIAPDVLPPAVLMMLVESVSRLLLIDGSLGVTKGHAELVSFIDQQLRRLEPQADADDVPATSAAGAGPASTSA